MPDPLNDLLEYLKSEGRICPQPQFWNELWEMLPEKHRVGKGWEPPLPLILAAWSDTSDLEKIARLKEHIKYAADHGVLENVADFLRRLSFAQWHTLNEVKK